MPVFALKFMTLIQIKLFPVSLSAYLVKFQPVPLNLGLGTNEGVDSRAVNKPSRSFTVLGEGPYNGLYLVENAY